MTQSLFVRAASLASLLLAAWISAPASAQDLATTSVDEVAIFQTADGGLLVGSVENGQLTFTGEHDNGPDDSTSNPPKDSGEGTSVGTECLYHIFPSVFYRFGQICKIEYDLCVLGHEPLRTICMRHRFVMCDGRAGAWQEGCRIDPRHLGIQ